MATLRLSTKKQHQHLRSQRVRSHIKRVSERPRLSVNISNRHIIAQIIDDSQQKTLAYATTVGSNSKTTKSLTDQAREIGIEISKQAKAAKITKVTFDRGSRMYHGRIKSLADAARSEGLEI